MGTQKVVVIGAGIGGLTAAALLAKAGLDVTVLEAHVDPGGCAATFYHQGYRFDAGATLVGGFQPGGAHTLVGERLGLRWPVERTEPAMQVHLPDQVVTRWGDDERWRAECRRSFPGTEHFWRAQEWLADRLWAFAASAPPWPPQSPADFLRLVGKLRPGLVGLAPGVVGNVGHWADRLGTRDRTFRAFLDAQLLIAAQATAERVNPLYGAVALDLARQGVFHVAGGVGGIAETLVGAVKGAGGRVLFKRRVTRLERRPDGSLVVHVRAGARHSPRREDYPTDLVLANLTPWNLEALLTKDEGRTTEDGGHQTAAGGRRQAASSLPMDEEALAELCPSLPTSALSPLSSSVLRPLSSVPRPDLPMWGAFMTYVGLDAEAVPNGLPDHHQIVMDYEQPLGEGNSVFMSLSPAWDTTRAPTGQRVMTLSTHTHIQSWWALCQADRDAYLGRRAEYTHHLLCAAERVIPGLRSQARLILPATPITFEFYTGRRLGMVGGFPQASLFRAQGPRTRLPNVLLVGDSIFPGQSTAAVTLGALRVVNELLGNRE